MTARALYDPAARRDTPLARILKDRIRASGPITVADYMHECLTHPEHGYYTTRQAIGGKGDFITAPEISQVFGELIGLWCAVVWQQMGAPKDFVLAEIGPGRGTMMRDMLRATRKVPGFLDSAAIHLVDIVERPDLAEFLKPATSEMRILSHRDVGTLPKDRPTILVANEWLDTLPVQQFMMSDGACYIRSVGLDADGNLQFVRGQRTRDPDAQLVSANPHLNDGDIFEANDLSHVHTLAFGRTAPWAALMIDYGHFDPMREPDRITPGDSLQALRNHAYEHPLTSPGEADLTAQVDFDDMALNIRTASETNRNQPLTIDGPVVQAQFLASLGIIERAHALMRANPTRANEIETAVARLIAVPGMGDRFKVIGWRTASLPPLPGFEPPPRTASPQRRTPS
ncbi:MAG TPA: SAM-dependent methyltransferase [Hyphomicrobiaceae bacterium]|nr:SAM-dependent methyltransferase [Hyphomicrobiaceae bacterium]